MRPRVLICPLGSVVTEPSDELREFMRQFRELSDELRSSITPEFVSTLDDAQAAWMMEHLEMIRDESIKLKGKIEELLAKQAVGEFADSDRPFKEGDEQPKPEEGDVLIIHDWAANGGAIPRRVQVHCVFDSLAESWDPFGEHAWAQHDVNNDWGYRGHWYAIVYQPNDEGETWSVASYEVEEVVHL